MKRAKKRLFQSPFLWMSCSFVLFFLLLLLLMTGFMSGNENQKAPIGQTIAIVNGKEIDKSRLYELLIDSGGKQALEKLIVDELIKQEADKQKVAITEDEIDQELDILKREYDSPEEYRNKLAEDGFTDRSMRSQIRTQLLLRELLAAKTDVTDEDVRSYYEQNKALWSEPDAVRVSHIVVQTKEKADELAAKLNNGADFAQLAQLFSLDPGAKSNGGDLGFIERGYLEQNLEETAFGLQPGQAAQIVESSQGFHVVVVTERKEGAAVSFSEREIQLRNELLDAEIYDLIGPWLEELRAGASIELLQLQ
ncbi:peptidylprolyl isomerase [Paenibacillus sp. PL91]|uniref:peptidylprolyl isomerase n=1 Tax=Paenibacillus sp. PL91 TaxID=2729538 RepID=UPI00145CB836|nr:peptidylprolyl isomerase [Paenibacillus sp. PL91]MBC9198768.1 peptidylprolyl isomerase [Paenibacillus sp. PL91]